MVSIKQKKCKNCCEKFTPFKSTDKTCSPECFYALEKEKPKKVSAKKEKAVKPKPKKKQGVKHLKKKLDTVFSKYIRLRDNNTCVVCGSKEYPNNGHYLSRISNATRFCETNCNCQCAKCNKSHEYNPEPYRAFMVRKYGEDVIQELNRRWRTTMKISVSEYEEMIEYYKEKVKEFEKEN